MEGTGETVKTNSKKPMVVIGIVLALALVALPMVLSKKDTQTDIQNSTVSETVTNEESKSYTLAEVSAHSTKEDCWLAIEGKVYDVSAFVDKHGGGEAILMGCGKDATELFNNRPNDKGAHSDKARSFLPNFEIGTLVVSE